jgi:hypothetical protein
LAQNWVCWQGFLKRKIEAITEEPCGYDFSASKSAITGKLGEQWEAEFPYLTLDERDEQVPRDAGFSTRAVAVTLAIERTGLATGVGGGMDEPERRDK